VATGEGLHVQGHDGVVRAKRWLERTGRVEAAWTAYDRKAMLTIHRPSGAEDLSFDLGGLIRGGDLDGSVFFAEVKKYDGAHDQQEHYTKYLANCYCMMLGDRAKPYEFMFITWHPFSLGKWNRLCEADEVERAVDELRVEWLGEGAEVDRSLCELVAARLWLLVLSDKQESLTMSTEMLAQLRHAATLGTKR
jgi:hypothetical protein